MRPRAKQSKHAPEEEEKKEEAVDVGRRNVRQRRRVRVIRSSSDTYVPGH